jgi:hypothetical protein
MSVALGRTVRKAALEKTAMSVALGRTVRKAASERTVTRAASGKTATRVASVPYTQAEMGKMDSGELRQYLS